MKILLSIKHIGPRPRNKLTGLLRAAEKNYYAEKLEYHRSNLHKTWQTINTVLGRKSKRNSIHEILHNNTCINDSKSMAHIFKQSGLGVLPFWEFSLRAHHLYRNCSHLFLRTFTLPLMINLM